MAEMDFQLSLSNVQITGYYYDLRFKDPCLKGGADGMETLYFLLENGDYLLNTAYVKAPSENAPVVLLIPGSGPNDYNETIGILPTFQDLAQKLPLAAAPRINILTFLLDIILQELIIRYLQYQMERPVHQPQVRVQ